MSMSSNSDPASILIISNGPDYLNGNEGVIGFDEIPLTKYLYTKLREYIGSNNAQDLRCTGSYHCDLAHCNIGFQGHMKREKVIGIQLDASMPMYFQWFKHAKPVGQRIELSLNNGDIYIMSENAIGCNLRIQTIYTVQHVNGSDKYLTLEKPDKSSPAKRNHGFLI